MKNQNDTMFTFRWNQELDNKFRDFASYNGLSAGSLVRKILFQYMRSKSLVK